MKNITINGFTLPIELKTIEAIVRNHNPSSKLSINKLLFVAIYVLSLCDILFIIDIYTPFFISNADIATLLR